MPSLQERFQQFKNTFKPEPGKGKRVISGIRNVAANTANATKATGNAIVDWGKDRWNSQVDYWKQTPEMWREFKQHPSDFSKGYVKGFSNKAVDAANGLWGTVVDTPASLGNRLGSSLIDMAYPDPATAPKWTHAYKDAIPTARKQLHAPMRPFEIANEKVQNSDVLKEQGVSGKAQEWSRRFGAGTGTAAETALWGTALGGPGFWRTVAAHPVKAGIGAWVGDVIGNGLFMNDRDRANVAGGEYTYDQQTNEWLNARRQDAVRSAVRDNLAPNIAEHVRAYGDPAYHIEFTQRSLDPNFPQLTGEALRPLYWNRRDREVGPWIGLPDIAEKQRPSYIDTLQSIKDNTPVIRDVYRQALSGYNDEE